MSKTIKTTLEDTLLSTVYDAKITELRKEYEEYLIVEETSGAAITDGTEAEGEALPQNSLRMVKPLNAMFGVCF